MDVKSRPNLHRFSPHVSSLWFFFLSAKVVAAAINMPSCYFLYLLLFTISILHIWSSASSCESICLHVYLSVQLSVCLSLSQVQVYFRVCFSSERGKENLTSLTYLNFRNIERMKVNVKLTQQSWGDHIYINSKINLLLDSLPQKASGALRTDWTINHFHFAYLIIIIINYHEIQQRWRTF